MPNRIQQHRSPIFVRTSSDVPATATNPIFYYVEGPPVQIFLVDKDGKKELGWSALSASTGDLTLTTANQDVPGSGPSSTCSVTLPTPGTYIIVSVFDMRLQAATIFATGTLSGIGVLTDSSDVEQSGVALTEWEDPIGVMSNDGMTRATVTQVWRVTTTIADEVFKLRARRTDPGGTVTLVVKATHTTIAASGFLGGATSAGAATHQHAEADITDLDHDAAGTGHAPRHKDGSVDELKVEELATIGAPGTVPTSDGAGALTMQTSGHPRVYQNF